MCTFEFGVDYDVQGGGTPTLEADVWALGAVMAEIAADGKPPFHALPDAAVAELLRGGSAHAAQSIPVVARDLLQLPNDTPGASLTGLRSHELRLFLVCMVLYFQFHCFAVYDLLATRSRLGQYHTRLHELESARETNGGALRSTNCRRRWRGLRELLLLVQQHAIQIAMLTP
jgi:hypothetical protein